jgi:hypothetical protein
MSIKMDNGSPVLGKSSDRVLGKYCEAEGRGRTE